MTDIVGKLISAASALAALTRHGDEGVMNWTWLVGPRSYQPEAHYMRGPGPKWRAKHGGPVMAAAGPRRRSSMM